MNTTHLCYRCLKQSLILWLVGLLGCGSVVTAQTARLSYHNFDGTLAQTVEINDNTPNGPVLGDDFLFGYAAANMGDLDGNGVNDLVVATNEANDLGGLFKGAVHILYMNSDGSVSSTIEINDQTTNGPVLNDIDRFGAGITNMGDLDGNGVNDMAVGADLDDAGGFGRGAVHILYLNADGSVGSTIEINDLTPNGPILSNGDAFGEPINMGDLDGNGINDMAVGAWQDDAGGTNIGAVHIFYLNANGSVINTVEINDYTPNGPVLNSMDSFGISAANMGDLDGNGVNDLAVGAMLDDAGGSNRGAVHIFYLNADGSVSSTIEINDLTPNGPVLSDSDYFGASIANMGDLDGNGVNDLAVGAMLDDAGGSNRGAVHILFLNTDGSVINSFEINNLTPNGPVLSDLDYFSGYSTVNMGDINGDGVNDMAVGTYGDDAGGSDSGAVHILFFNAPPYDEAVTNDGSLDNSNPLKIRIHDDTFAATDGSVLPASSYTINNVPAGLTPVLTIGNSQTTATLTFTGTATAHQNSDDVANLSFVFADTAFSTITSANVVNSGSSTPYSSNTGIDFQNNTWILHYSAVPDYPEATVNNGSLNNSAPLVITLSGDTFASTDGTKLSAAQVSVGNVPPGLTPVLTIGNSQTTATLTFTGTATAHQNSDDVTNLTFQFTDAAFNSVSANVIVNSGSTTPFSSTTGIDFQENPRLDYSENSPFDVSEAVYAGTAEEWYVGGQVPNPRALAFSPDGRTLFVIDVSTGGRIIEYHLGTAWDVSTATNAGAGEELDVSGEENVANGLAFSVDGSKLFVIGAIDDAVVTYHLGTPWDVSTAVYAGAGEELDVSGEETASQDLAFSPDGRTLFVVGAEDDAVVTYNLGTPWEVSTAVYAGIGEELVVRFQEGIPTGLAFSSDGSTLFITGFSDDFVVEYHLGTPWDVSTAVYAGVAEEFYVGAEEASPEGIAFSPDGSKFFVIGWNDDAVVTYNMPLSLYSETTANNGSVDNSTPLVITLSGDTFAVADGAVLPSTSYTIPNAPAGLTPVLTIGNGQTTATLTFTGTATAHQHRDDVTNLTFQFTDAAFSSVSANVVANSGSTTPYSSSAEIDFHDNANSTKRYMRHGKHFVRGKLQPMRRQR